MENQRRRKIMPNFSYKLIEIALPSIVGFKVDLMCTKDNMHVSEENWEIWGWEMNTWNREGKYKKPVVFV